MDNGEQKKSLKNQGELGDWVPEDWLPDSPKHNLSELGGKAIGNTIISSNPDTDLLQSTKEIFDIKEVSPTPMPESASNQISGSTDATRLVFDPQDIVPKENGLSSSTKTAIQNIRDLFIRGDNQKDGYTNYQALRRQTNGGQSK